MKRQLSWQAGDYFKMRMTGKLALLHNWWQDYHLQIYYCTTITCRRPIVKVQQNKFKIRRGQAAAFEYLWECWSNFIRKMTLIVFKKSRLSIFKTATTKILDTIDNGHYLIEKFWCIHWILRDLGQCPMNVNDFEVFTISPFSSIVNFCISSLKIES